MTKLPRYMSHRKLAGTIFKVARAAVIFSTMSAMAVSPLVNTITPYLPRQLAEHIEVKDAFAALDTRIYLTVANGTLSGNQSSGNWTVPVDWNNASNSVELIGAGGTGGDGAGGSAGAGGGGGGGYGRVNNLVLTGATAHFSVGASGSQPASTGRGGNGGNTWFGQSGDTTFAQCFSTGPTGCVSAEGGEGGGGSASGPAFSGGPGGGTSSTSFTPGFGFAGGNGGVGNTADPSGGGGGAAGPGGTGKNGGAAGTTTSDGGGGGGGGGGSSSTAGGNGTTTTGGNGGNGYGGGAGGSGNTGGNGAAGVNVGSGGGGGDAGTTFSGGNGAAGQQWDSTHGSGGGGGGSGDSTAGTGGRGGRYGGGGGGGDANSAAIGNGRGGDGLIVITYRAITNTVTPTAVGTQTTSIDIPAATTNTYIGGAFKLTTTLATTVTSIAVTASTSTGAVTGLNDVKLYWDTDLECDTTDPISTATLYNTASANFSSLKATISGSTTIAYNTPKCFYPTMDVGTTVTDGMRFDMKVQAATDITTPLTEAGSYPVEISGVTTFATPAATIDISGTCKQFDQSTNCTQGSKVVRVAVNGVLQAQTDTSFTSDAWSITGVTQPAADAIITAFIESEGASNSQAVGVTKYNGSGNIGGIELIEAHLSIGSDQNNTITNANLSQYDSSVSGKKTFHDVSGTTLTVDTDTKVLNDELYVGVGDTYQPNSGGGDTITAGHIEIIGTLTADGNSFTASGSWDDNGTFTAGASTLTMTGVSKTLDASTFNNLTINPSSAGTITASGSFTVSGTLDVAANDVLSIPSGVTITHSGATLTLSGTISGAGRLTYRSSSAFPTTGTISSILRFDATSNNQIISQRTFTGAVEIDNSGATSGRTVTLGTAGSQTITFSGGLTIQESGTGNIELTGSSNNPTVSITGSLTCPSGTLNNITTGSGNWTVSTDVDFTGCNTITTTGGTITMSGTGTLTSNGKTLNNFTINSSGTVTLAAATHTVAGNLVLSGAGTPVVTGSTISMTGTANTVNGGSKTLAHLTIDPSSAGIITLTNDVTVSGTLTVAANDTFTVNPSVTLTLSGTGTPLSVSGLFEPDDTSTVTYSGSSATVTGTTFGNLTLGGTGTYILPSSGTPTIKGNLSIALGTTVTSGSATLRFRRGGVQTVTDSTAAKQNLGEIAVMASTGGNTTLVMDSAVRVASLSVDASQILAAGSQTLTINGSGNVFTNDGIFQPGTGTVVYTGATPNITATKYKNLTLGGTGTYTLPSSGTTTLLGDFVVTSGATVASGSSTLFFRAGGTQSVTDNNVTKQNLGELAVQASTSGATTLTLGSSVRIASATVDVSQTLHANGSNTLTITGVGSPFTVPGIFTRSTGAVTFIGSGATNIPALNYYDLNAQPSADGITYTFLSGTASVSKTFTVGNATNIGTIVDVDANGTGLDMASVSISENATLVADSVAELTIMGNFVNNGSFTHSSGTVTFAGTGTSSILGGTAFNHFVSAAAGKKIKFGEHNTFSIEGNFTVTGTPGSQIFIESTASGSQWGVNFSNPQSGLMYTTIRDSGCTGGSAYVDDGLTGLVDAGNNGVCWFRHPVPGAGNAGGFPGGGQSGGGSQRFGGGQSGGGGTTEGNSGGGSQQSGGGQSGGGGGTP